MHADWSSCSVGGQDLNRSVSALICFLKTRISCFGLTDRKDKAVCFKSKSADEEACVTVKIERTRGKWRRLLLPLYFFSFFLFVWWYFRTHSTSGWLFNGCKAFTAHSHEEVLWLSGFPPMLKESERVSYCHNRSAPQHGRKVARLEAPGTFGCSPPFVWQPVPMTTCL